MLKGVMVGGSPFEHHLLMLPKTERDAFLVRVATETRRSISTVRRWRGHLGDVDLDDITAICRFLKKEFGVEYTATDFEKTYVEEGVEV